MKKYLILTVILFLSNIIQAQYVRSVKADTVRVTNDSCNAELILENSTKDTAGYLFNTGKGQTIFKKPLVYLGNGTYALGLDTIWAGVSNGHDLQSITTLGNSTSNSLHIGQDSYFNGVRIGVGGATTISNTILGVDAFSSNTFPGSENNIAIGYHAMKFVNNADADANIAIGESSLFESTSGKNNVALGFRTLRLNSTGSANTAIGHQAMFGFPWVNYNEGDSNVAVGFQSMVYHYRGHGNVAAGYESLFDSLNYEYNTAVGHFSGRNANADSSVYIGAFAGRYNEHNQRLFIENSSSSTPLLHGNFNTDSLRMNAALSIGSVDSSSAAMNMLYVAAGGRIAKAPPGIPAGTISNIISGHGMVTDTITSTGNLVLDSAYYATRLWLQKGLDSLAQLTRSIDTATTPGIGDNYDVPAAGINLVILKDLSAADYSLNLFMPVTAEEGKIMYFFNQNSDSENIWIFNGPNVPVDTAGNEYYALDNQTVYTLCFAGGRWRIVSKY